MAQANISLLSSTVVDSYSSQDTSYPWSNLLDGNTATNGRSASGNPSDQWVIIDLGSIFSLTGFKIWNTSFADATQATQYFRIEISATTTDAGAFVEVVPDTILFQKGLFGIGIGFTTRSISATNARYVKLYLSTNYGNTSYISLSDFEIYSESAITDIETVSSNAEIFSTSPTTTIISDAFISATPTFKDRISITSDASITLDKSDILSDAYIVDALINSDAHIEAEELVTISSDAYVYQSGSFCRKSALLYGRANSFTDPRDIFVYSADISSSDETVVTDTVMGPVMDMTTVSPPLGYNNYDWKYDWVVRIFNKCQYKFEVRSAETLLDLSAEPFHEIALGAPIYKGQVKRYHQWLCHVWASGSGDFELHQFTIKGYIDYPANPFYRALREKPFVTTSHVIEPGDSWSQQEYEPPLAAAYWRGPYIPGDVNADNAITQDDINLLTLFLFSGYPADSIPAPGAIRGAWDTGVSPEINDLLKMLAYVYSAGPPPSRRDEPS